MEKDSVHQQSVPATSSVQQAREASGDVVREEVDVAPVMAPLDSRPAADIEEHHALPLQDTELASLPASSRPTPEGAHNPPPTVTTVPSSSQSAEQHAPSISATTSGHTTASGPPQVALRAGSPSQVHSEPPVVVSVGDSNAELSATGPRDAQPPTVGAGRDPVIPDVISIIPSTQPHSAPTATLVTSSSRSAEQDTHNSSAIVSDVGHITAPIPVQGAPRAESPSHVRSEPAAIVSVGNSEASSSSRAQRDIQISVVEASNESSSSVHVASGTNSPSHAQPHSPAAVSAGSNDTNTSWIGRTDAPPVQLNANHGPPSPVVPEVINILPHTQFPIILPERPAGTDNSGNSSPTSQRHVQLTARPSHISIPPASPSIHSVYYSPHQSIIYAIDSSGTAIPLTASPLGTPPIPYIPAAASLSRQGSPVSFIQTINGQPMLVQPLGTTQDQSVLHNAASLSRVSQPAAPGLATPAPVPTAQYNPRQPIRRVSPPTFEVPIPGPSGSPRSEDIPPAVPPKPPVLAHAASASTGSAPQRGGGGGGIIFPAAGPSNRQGGPGPMTTSSSDPPRQRALSFNDPPRTERARRTENVPLTTYNGPPLTAIGTGPYPPPHAPTPWDDGPGRGVVNRNGSRNGFNGDGDYFTNDVYQNDHPTGSTRRVPQPQSSPHTPNRTYSPGSEHRRPGYQPRYRSSLRNGHSSINMGDVNGGGEYGLSRRGSRISSSNPATLNNEPQDLNGGGGGGRGDEDDEDGGGMPGIFRRMTNWIRGKPKKKKQASEVADALGVQERDKTIAERLAPTLIHAEDALRKARSDANVTGWSLNIAIGLQVLLGALTTGVAAATSGRHTSIAVTVLGGLSTLAASYLAKARGSNEPEASVLRCSELENFVRELQNLSIDMGAQKGGGEHHDTVVQNFRDRFEKIMGSPSGGLMGDFVRERMADSRRHLEEQVNDSKRYLEEQGKVRSAESVVGVGVGVGVNAVDEREEEGEERTLREGEHQHQRHQQQHDDTREKKHQTQPQHPQSPPQSQQQQHPQSQQQQPQQHPPQQPQQQPQQQPKRNKGKEPQRPKE